MKIKKVGWKNHPILGDFTLDCTLPNGDVAKTIVLAGENGTGKSTILDSLFKTCNFEEDQYLERIEILHEKRNEIISLENVYNTSSRPAPIYIGMKLTLPDGSNIQINYAKKFNPQRIGSIEEDPRIDGCAYSTAQAIYSVGKVSNISTKELDSQSLDKNTKEFTPQTLKELLIDIDAQDKSDYAELGASSPYSSNPYSQFVGKSRIARFSNAFNIFFNGNLVWGGIKINSGEHEVYFKKHGNKIPIGNLSTGESQIVYRGGQLLMNIKNIDHGVAFIDEPEISMHPSWQSKILKYYKDIYSSNGQQTGQLFVATHSEGVVREALSDPSTKVIVLRRDQTGNILEAKAVVERVLPSVTASETNFQAFDIYSIDYHIALYAQIQQISGETSIKKVDEYIFNSAEYTANPLPKPDTFTFPNGGSQTYQTLPTYIRNRIDHPDPAKEYTDDEMQKSIELMRQIIKHHP